MLFSYLGLKRRWVQDQHTGARAVESTDILYCSEKNNRDGPLHLRCTSLFHNPTLALALKANDDPTSKTATMARVSDQMLRQKCDGTRELFAG